MKSKTELEQIVKLPPEELLKLKRATQDEILTIKAKLASNGQKSNDKIGKLRRKIARVETVLSNKLEQQIGE